MQKYPPLPAVRPAVHVQYNYWRSHQLLSQLYFTCMTPNKDQQHFCSPIILVLQLGDIHELHRSCLAACVFHMRRKLHIHTIQSIVLCRLDICCQCLCDNVSMQTGLDLMANYQVPPRWAQIIIDTGIVLTAKVQCTRYTCDAAPWVDVQCWRWQVCSRKETKDIVLADCPSSRSLVSR